MATREKSDEPPNSKKWECGDPYQYQIPANGDHWEDLLTPLMESDKAQCEGWKDEVQNLLIFAGLFSGVLTAFVIESYQGLQPDPNDVMIALLTRIATRLDNPLNGTASVPQQMNALPSNSPLPSSIRINIFWFVGLVLSLTTALIGIVSLQWLRAHQQYPTSISSKQRFALFNMRARGLEAWYVPQIFASLPVLLQFALVLFFVGLIEFLLASETKVAIPVIIIIGMPLVFLVWTTVMPSLQAFVMCLPLAGRVDRIPVQCPYKSTQSMILRHIITFSQPSFWLLSHSATTAHSLLVLLPLRLVKPSIQKAPNSGEVDRSIYEIERETLFGDVFETWCRKNWLNFDQDWLTLRDAYAHSISDGAWSMSLSSRHDGKKVGPLYDLVGGLSLITTENVDSTIQSSAFHCIRDLTSSIIGKNSQLNGGNLQHNQYFQKLLGHLNLTERFPTFSSLTKEPSLDLLCDENSFIFLSKCPRTPSLILLQHFAELHIRILNYPYPTERLTDTSDFLSVYPDYPKYQLMYSYGKKDNILEAAFDAHISAQFSLIVDSFIKSVADQDIDDATLLHSVHVQNLEGSLTFAVLRQSEDAIQPTLESLSTALDRYTVTDGELGQRSDFTFYISAFYARSLISDPWDLYWGEDSEWDDNPLVEAFLPVLRHYLEERGTPDTALGERLGIPSLSDLTWWGFLNRAREMGNNGGEEGPKIIAPVEKNLNNGPAEDSALGMNPNAGDLV